jgi:beta-RFAP synthase
MKKITSTTDSRNITVVTGGRLHMGFFDLHGGVGRKFGSIGLSLTEPNLKISVSTSEKLRVFGTPSVADSTLEKASSIAQVLLEKLNITNAITIDIVQHISEHSGLGSGTQLALAIGAAIRKLHHLNLTTEQIALLTGRGGRSGIGIAAFDKGGLLIDGGRTTRINATSSHLKSARVPPLIARYDFPSDWRILLIFDSSQPGIHGENELLAFSQLPEFPENLAAHLCRYVLMQAMPALVEHDLTAFGNSIQALQCHVGDYFAPAQGGRYASQLVGSVLHYLDDIGVACFGQSSWGPTGFAIFENDTEAEKLLKQLKMKFTNENLSWKICSARNHGAELT